MDGFAAEDKPRALALGAPPEAPATVEHSASFTVRRSDLDREGHANNVRFLEWTLEALATEDGLRTIDMLYRSEAVAGDTVLSEAGPLVGTERSHRLSSKSDGRTLALSRTVWTP